MFYLVLFVIFFAAMLVYFRIADHFNIIDKPNERSSHKEITIRGGGIIFPLAAVIAAVVYPAYLLPMLAVLVIGFISFIDDRITLSSRIRIIFHLAAVSMLFYYLQLFTSLPVYGVVFLYILVIGIINACNFMDGINGITGVYSLVVLGSLQYVNLYVTPFTEPDLIWLPMIAAAVFLFFNFRIKAKCFAGDVGSVSIALWMVMLLLQLIIASGEFEYILFLSVYGIDTVFTIIQRLMMGQNIFEAHRLHFYQLLANEKKIPHLVVASCYGIVQLLINTVVISTGFNFVTTVIIICVPLMVIYLLVKPRLSVNTKVSA